MRSLGEILREAKDLASKLHDYRGLQPDETREEYAKALIKLCDEAWERCYWLLLKWEFAQSCSLPQSLETFRDAYIAGTLRECLTEALRGVRELWQTEAHLRIMQALEGRGNDENEA